MPNLPLEKFETRFKIFKVEFAPFDRTILSKSPDEMKALVDGDESKEKWERIKAFLKGYRYDSWEDIFLLVERVYRASCKWDWPMPKVD